MNSIAVYDRVASGELTPEQGAQELMDERRKENDWSPQQPKWMPRWAYIIVVIAISIALAPIKSSGRRHA